MDASCGPSNALQNLSKHAQRDKSLQNELINRQGTPGSGQQSFRSSHAGVDESLNQQFQQFSQDQRISTPPFQFDPASQHYQQHHQQHHQQHNQHVQQFHQNHPQQQPVQQQPAQQRWVQDFSQLSINKTPQSSDWHTQFITQQQQQQQQPSQHQRGVIQPNYTNANFQMNMRTNLSDPLYRSVPTEHQEVHRMDQEKQIFDDQFDQLEKELESQQQHEQFQHLQPEVVEDAPQHDNEHEKLEFANTAKKVHESMLSPQATQSSTTSDKFQQSNFLKLMQSISHREVELSTEGNKLVDRDSGQDIRQLPVSDTTTATVDATRGDVDYHRTMHESDIIIDQGFQPPQQPHQQPHQHQQEQQEQQRAENRSHLPDPLAHIKDGSLGPDLQPLEAARIISGNQVQTHDWMEDDAWMNSGTPPVRGGYTRKGGILNHHDQEVFDDYRHDDDSH